MWTSVIHMIQLIIHCMYYVTVRMTVILEIKNTDKRIKEKFVLKQNLSFLCYIFLDPCELVRVAFDHGINLQVSFLYRKLNSFALPYLLYIFQKFEVINMDP